MEGRKDSRRIVLPRRGFVRVAAVLVCLAALLRCGDDEPDVKTGQWGGLGSELNVTTSGPSVLL